MLYSINDRKGGFFAMQAYRFKTRISDKGIITIPDNPDLYDKDVEILIFPRQDMEQRPLKGRDFVERWAGCLKEPSPEDARYRHLSKKYS
jgi:hypothetical protein